MPLELFKKILLKSLEEPKDSLTSIQVALLKYLYSTFHPKSNSDKYLSALKNEIVLTGKEPSSYSREELYKEAYNAMIIFYKHARYSYESKDKKKIIEIEIMGKDVIVEQARMKCEAIIAKDGDAHTARYRMTSPVEYTPMPDHWDISTKIYGQYHIQFVDNSLHTLRRVCIPIFRISNDGYPNYFHTISDIIKYLERIYNIKETGKIYPLKIEKNGSTWKILTDDDKKRTMKYFKEVEKFSIVFYYIKEGLESKPFTLSVFKRPNSENKDKQEISLFLFSFMECAMEQLGLYTKKHGYDSTQNQKKLLKGDGIKPCVYECTNPGNDKTIYSQIQLYYSRFYIHEKIKEHTELCPILSISKQEICKKIGEYKVTWYVRAPGHPQEYTHYYFDKSDGSGEYAGRPIITKILTKLKEKNRATNNPAYAFYTGEITSIPYRIFFFQQENKKIYEKYDRIKTPQCDYQLVTFKTFNPTKSDLGIHSEIFRILLSKTITSSNKEVLS